MMTLNFLPSVRFGTTPKTPEPTQQTVFPAPGLNENEDRFVSAMPATRLRERHVQGRQQAFQRLAHVFHLSAEQVETGIAETDATVSPNRNGTMAAQILAAQQGQSRRVCYKDNHSGG